MPRTKMYYWVSNHTIFKTKRDKKTRLSSGRFNTLGEAKDHLQDTLQFEIRQRRQQLRDISKIRATDVEDRS
jgi:hypothetical protein